MRRKVCIAITLLTCMLLVPLSSCRCDTAEEKPCIGAADLLEPDMFPNAQFGMAVESAEDGPIARVITTGGEFVIDKSKDTIECKQRIAKQRTVTIIKLAKGSLKNVNITYKTSGAAIFYGNGSTVRINGDSLLMIQPVKNGSIKATLGFVPDYHSEFYGNYNFFDPDGGVSFFEHGKCPKSIMDAAKDPVTVEWPWKGGDVFWAGISPPKPYDWNATIKNKVVRWGNDEDRFMYPSDLEIYRFSNNGFGNILFLMCDQWKHWNLDLTVKNLSELKRVINTSHEYGMKVMVYASPMYFIKGTSVESRASKEPGVYIGWHMGSNEDLYIKEATRIVKEYGVDGLYFDGIYPSRQALATEYHLSRVSRDLVGPNGILEYHNTTDALGDGHIGTYFPTLHAYYDYILNSEGEEKRIDPGYIRYVVSTYNISNSIAVSCFFNTGPNAEQVDRLIRANIHFHLPEHFIWSGEIDVFRKYYWPRLNPGLEKDIGEFDLPKRTGIFEQFRKSIYKEYRKP